MMVNDPGSAHRGIFLRVAIEAMVSDMACIHLYLFLCLCLCP